MGLKIIAIGFRKFLQDKMNYMDGIVVILSLIEIALSSGGGALSAFRVIRIFRTFRVLRVARLLRSMKSMMNIISVIQNSISSFIYLTILLFLFVFIYSLLGMQIYGGNFNFKDGVPRTNFDSFSSAFLSSFIVLSLEKWDEIFYIAMASGTNFIINALYFVSWIFIGNYMLLNLFLAIMLESFSQIESEDHLTQLQIAEREKKREEELLKKEGNDLILSLTHFDSVSHQQNNQKKSKKTLRKKKKKKKGVKEESKLLDESIEIDLETL